MVEYKDVAPSDKIEYKCKGCADCCKDIGGVLVVEPYDAYRLAKHLGRASSMDIYNDYCHFVPLNKEGIGAFVMNDVDGSCILLEENRCTIYDGRPRICRIYPFACHYNDRSGKLKYQLSIDNHIHHYSGGEYVKVREWFKDALTKEDKYILENSMSYISRFISLMGKVRKPENIERARVLYLIYYFLEYSTDKDFIQQYRLNMIKLEEKLKQIVMEES